MLYEVITCMADSIFSVYDGFGDKVLEVSPPDTGSLFSYRVTRAPSASFSPTQLRATCGGSI